MKFGKLNDISAVDFTLPETPRETERVLGKYPKTERLEIYTGSTGWGVTAWKGKIYPKRAKPQEFLHYYGKSFNTIELNTTHYSIPNDDRLRQWVEAVPADFKYCPKFTRQVSHTKQLHTKQEQANLFCDVMQQAGDKLGVTFMQMPPYFSPRELPYLQAFLEAFPADYELAIEFRNADFFSSETAVSEAFDLLETYGVSSVITDVAGRRDVLHLRQTTDTAVIRYVGNGLHPTDYTRIDDWIERLRDWQGSGLRRVYFWTHEPDAILSPEITAYFVDEVNKAFELELRSPDFRYKHPEATQTALF